MPFVYSTTTCDGSYVEYRPDTDKNRAHSEALRVITIKGGHGVVNRQFVTPKGVATKVTDEELEWLLKNDTFQRHVKAGFITYDKRNIDPEKKAADMAQADGAAPLTPKDFEESENSSAESRIYKGRPKK